MSKKLNLYVPFLLGIFLMVLSFLPSVVKAQVVNGRTNAYWDVNGTTTGEGGSGATTSTTWSSSSVYWTTNAVNATAATGGPTGGGLFSVTSGAPNTATAANSGGYYFNFTGTPGIVAMGASMIVSGLNFAADGYTLTTTTGLRTITGTNAIVGSVTNQAVISLSNNVNLTLASANADPATAALTISSNNIVGGTGSSITLGTGAASVTNSVFGGSVTIDATAPIRVNIGTGSKFFFGSQSSGGLTVNANITNNSASGVALNITNSSSGAVALNGVISGNNGLVLDQFGTGKIVLAGANTYAGGTTLNMVTTNNSPGEIWASNNAAFGTGTITTGTGTNYVRSASVTISNAVTIGTGSTLRLGGITGASDKSTWSGVISGAGGINYSLADEGLFLTGTNSSFGGGINLGSSGTLYVSKLGMAGANSSIGTNGTITISPSGTTGAGKVRWTGSADEISDKNFALTTVSSGASAGVQILADGATNATLTLNGNINSTGINNKRITLAGYSTNTLRLNGLINETAGYTNSVVVGVSDSGTVILNGTNTFSGAVTITQQTAGKYTWLQTTNIGNSGDASALGKNGTINIGSTNATAYTVLKYTGTGETSDKVINLAGTFGGATLDQSGTGNLKFTSAITGTGLGDKTVQLAGSSAGTGELSGSLTNSPGNIISVSKSGTGTWALSASNSYSGGTTISGGTLQARNANAFGTGAVTVGSGGTLNVATVAVASTVKNSGTVSIGAGGTLSASTMAPDAGGQGSLVLGGTSGSLARFNSTVAQGASSSALTTLTLGNLTMNGNSVFSLQEIYTQISAATVTFAGTGNSIGLNGKSNSWGANTYTLLSGTGMSGADSNLLLDLGAGDTVALGSSLLVGLKTYSFSQSGTTLTMGITTAAVANQVWDSNVASGAWSTTAQNWLTDGTGTAVAFNSGDNAALNSTATIAVDAGGISAGAVTLTNSAATVNLTGGNLTAGTLNKSGGDLVLANGANSFSGIVNSAGTLTSTGALTTTAEGISASAGQVNLNGSNAVTGTLRVSGADVSVGANASLTSSSINLSSGSLALGTSASNGSLTISGGSITGAGTLTNTSVAASGGTIEASLAGTGGLTKTGASDFNLNNSANTFTGGVTVSAGKLSAGVANNLSGQAVTVNGGTLDIGGFNNTATSVDLQSGSITGTTGALTAAVTANAASGVTLSVGAGLTGNSSLTKNGLGTLTLSGSNSYTGATAVNFGTLETVGNDRLADSSAVTLAASTTLKLGGNETVASLAASSTTAALNLQGNTLNLGGTGLSFTNAALTTGTGGSLVKNGTGLMYLSNSANTYSGGFTLNNGEVQFTASGTAGAGVVTSSAFGTGTLTLNGGTIGSSSTSSGKIIYNNVTLNNTVQVGNSALFAALTTNGNAGTASLIISTNSSGSTTLLGDTTLNTVAQTEWQQNISGSAYRLTKGGSGALSISNNQLSLRGSNNIAGVTVNSGILGYKNRNALGTGTLILADGVVVGQDGTINNTGLTGNDQTDRAIANNIQLNGNVTFGLGNTGNHLGGNMDLNGAARTITLGNTTYQYGAVTNGGLVIDNGAASGNRTFALFASNNYSGGTVVRTNAILEVGNDNALGTGDLTFTNTAVSGLSRFTASTLLTNAIQQRTVTNNIVLSQGMNLTVDAVTGVQDSAGVTNLVTLNTSLSGAITGSGGLTKSNSNTLTLSGTNTYSGNTTISGGTLKIGPTNGLVNGVLIGNSATSSGSTLDMTAAGNYVMNSYGASSATYGQSIVFTNSSGGAGNYTLTFTNANNYASGGAAAGRTLNNASANLTVAFTGAVDIGSSVANEVLFTGPGNFTINGSVTNSLAAVRGLTKSGDGTLTLNGASGYNGTTTVTAGTLTLSGNNSTASGGVTLTAGTLNVNSANALGSGTLTLTAGTINNTSGAAVTNSVNSAVALSSGLNFGTSASTSSNDLDLGAGTVTVTTSRTLTLLGEGTTLKMGTLENTSGNTDRTFTFNGTGNTMLFRGFNIATTTATATTNSLAGSANLTISGVIANGNANANGVNIKGTGTTTFSGANTYTGGTEVFSGATLVYGASNVTADTGAVAISGAMNIGTFSDTVASVKVNDNGSLTGSSGVLSAGSFSMYGPNSVSAILGGGSATLLKMTADTVTLLSGANTYGGLTTVNGGTIKLGSSTALGTTAGATAVGSNGFLDLNGQTGVAETLNYGGTGGLLNSAAGTTAVVSGAVDIGSGMTVETVGDITLSGQLTGSVSKNLTKSGAGTLKFTAAGSSYTGTNTVSAGTLLVDTGASVTSSKSVVNGGLLQVKGTVGAVTVNISGSLGGSGSVGALTLNNGGALNPGNSPGTLTASEAIILGGSTYNWQITSLTGTAGTNWDLLSVTGLLNMTGVSSSNKWNLVITADSGFAGWTGTSEYSYVFAQAANVSGFSATVGTDVTDLFNITTSGITSLPNSSYNASGDFKVEVGSAAGGLTTLKLMTIPEPSTGSLLGFGLAGLVVTRLLRRKQS